VPHIAAYDLKPVRAPRLRGIALRMVVALLENPLSRPFVAPLLTQNLGLRELRAARIDEPPTFIPLHPGAADSGAAGASPEDVPRLLWRGSAFRFSGIREYQAAYETSVVTPSQVAERALAGIAAGESAAKPLRAFIAAYREDVLSQAHEATRRHQEGRTLGPLDGVPIAVKDEIDMMPYPTTAGTRFCGLNAAQADSTVVARLRSAGALLIGKTNMHEIGILPNGVNPHHGTVRNPYNPACEAGGSSGGSAAAVAAGLCSAAIGADGGGSIRIPAAYCGVVGLKPTFGRVSEFGATPLTWTVAQLGPIAATAEDAALLYAAIAGPDRHDSNTQTQPPVHFGEYDGTLKSLRIGIYRDWCSDASSDVVAGCERLLEQFVRLGAELVEVAIPDLRQIAVAHGLTIHTEMAASMNPYTRQRRRDFSLTTRLMLANARALGSPDYIQAQRIRSRAIEVFRLALSRADVIATPTTPMTAPEISESALAGRESDISQVMEIMRFVNPANLTGLPAISIPAGYDRHGLPIGLQMIGRPWEEGTLLRLAYVADGIFERRRPVVYCDLLPELAGSDG
jgi:Asp-tRNA(Asn)/Glu-tRNA(Gln) amidotransferase A subunit family amidase